MLVIFAAEILKNRKLMSIVSILNWQPVVQIEGTVAITYKATIPKKGRKNPHHSGIIHGLNRTAFSTINERLVDINKLKKTSTSETTDINSQIFFIYRWNVVRHHHHVSSEGSFLSFRGGENMHCSCKKENVK